MINQSGNMANRPFCCHSSQETPEAAGTEIKQENIKNQIKEIISDIDKEISIAEQTKEQAQPQDFVSTVLKALI